MEDFSKLVTFETCVQLFKEYSRLHGMDKVSDITLLHYINILLSNEPFGAGSKSFLDILSDDTEFVRYHKTMNYVAKQFELSHLDRAIWGHQLFMLRNTMIHTLVDTHGKIFGTLHLCNITGFCEEIIRDPLTILTKNGQGKNVLECIEMMRETNPAFYNSSLSYIVLRFKIPLSTMPFSTTTWTEFVQAEILRELESSPASCSLITPVVCASTN